MLRYVTLVLCIDSENADDEEDNDGALSPTSLEIQEKIRKLNERIKIADKAMSQAPKDIRPAIDLSKYKIVRKYVTRRCDVPFILVVDDSSCM